MNRREFLKLGLTLAIGGFAMTADAKTKISARKIDFHAHAILPGYVDALKSLKIDAAAEEGFPLPKWNVESHLEFMNAAKTDFTVLSMATPHISDIWLRCNVAIAANRRLNRRISLRDGKIGRIGRESGEQFGRSVLRRRKT